MPIDLWLPCGPLTRRRKAPLRLQIGLGDHLTVRINEVYEDGVIAVGRVQRAPIEFDAQRAAGVQGCRVKIARPSVRSDRRSAPRSLQDSGVPLRPTKRDTSADPPHCVSTLQTCSETNTWALRFSSTLSGSPSSAMNQNGPRAVRSSSHCARTSSGTCLAIGSSQRFADRPRSGR